MEKTLLPEGRADLFDNKPIERLTYLLHEALRAETPHDYKWLLSLYSCTCDDTEDSETDPCPRRDLHRAEDLGRWAIGVIRGDPWFRWEDHQEIPDSAYRAARAAAHFALIHLSLTPPGPPRG